ncbi:1,2-phenylacetyl-CoA epoxidase subunit PaaD [Cumulibacter manganitolerans]|uniref:1,2-phenylacetyl-CoA epoxidase subunit PaaD n=1 Tax=Cumulibacter manganitolerans TaxID=1884992 RepID=UPI001E528709|nr:1,2-phenylacetyl-CoA epoxidase subunit PaaD [Cumulibacter manganitolerans]
MAAKQRERTAPERPTAGARPDAEGVEARNPFGYGDRPATADFDRSRPKHPRDLPAGATPWQIAADVNDPEIPLLSIADLGILRDVSVDGVAVTVTITPTYSGCPAMKAIEEDLRRVFTAAGYGSVTVDVVLDPPWTTDWITPRGLNALQRSGITPPTGTRPAASGPVSVGLSVRCPYCDSFDTEVISRFGSTSCKALYRCNSCREPFDWFKPL